MLSTHKKTLQTIISTSNHYLAAVKGNQPILYNQITESFLPIESYFEVNKGHGRLEKRFIEIMRVDSDDYPDWPNLNTIIRVNRRRSFTYHSEEETCYYISSLRESASAIAYRIRGHWGVENRVHYVRDVTFGEDRSRIRTGFLPDLWAIREADLPKAARQKLSD